MFYYLLCNVIYIYIYLSEVLSNLVQHTKRKRVVYKHKNHCHSGKLVIYKSSLARYACTLLNPVVQ